MTQLLISVKNAAEAELALQAGADIIDLKDPSVGALGALNLAETARIVAAINGAGDGAGLLSATVGESHSDVNALILDIKARATMGIDVIKIAVSKLFYDEYFLIELNKLNIQTKPNIKIVVVFFADEALDLNLLPALAKAGAYGAMLDTKTKQQDLLAWQTNVQLQAFVAQCKKYQLCSGLAGSLKPQHIELLSQINPTYLGFRGGVCQNAQRDRDLSRTKVVTVKNMLRTHNKTREKAQEITHLALHS